MAARYIAFISYRHLPLDMAVAEKLHKLIERYRIPKELRSAPEQKTMGRVFRDREELPLSNDLTQDIYDALDDSEYLIVVCTPETPKSLWVDREIQHFLEHHDRDRVITVLAAGLPDQSIPRRITDVYGPDGVTVIDRREPLCAYLVDQTSRKVLRNLDKEFLRLVAALLEKPYDSIRQRQKLYRQRQIMAGCGVVAAVALAFAGVLGAKNFEINQKNDQILEQNEKIQAQNEEIARQLEQSLLNESEALTLLSRINLAGGDRMAALENAMAALPSEENQRPYYAPARDALEDALYLYETGYRVDRMLEQNYLSHQTMSESGRYLLADTYDEKVICIDLYTGETIWEYPMDDYMVMSLWFAEEQNAAVYVSCSGIHYVLNLEDGSLRCQYEFAKRSEPADFSPDGSVMAIVDDETVYFCSLAEQKLLQSETGPSGSRVHACHGAYNADGSRFLMLCEDDYGNGYELKASFFDTATGAYLNSFTLAPSSGASTANLKILDLTDNSWFVSSAAGGRQSYRVDESGILTQSYFTDLTEENEKGDYAASHLRQVGDQILMVLPEWICCLDADSCELLAAEELYWLGPLEVYSLWEDGSFLAVENSREISRYRLGENGWLKQVSPEWEYSGEIEKIFCSDNNSEVFLISEDYGYYLARWMDGIGDAFAVQESTELTLSGNLIYLPNFCGIWASPGGRMLFVMDTDATVDYDYSGRRFVYDLESGSIYEFTGAVPEAGAVFTADETKLISGNSLFDIQTGAVTTLEGTGLWATTRSSDRLPGEAALTACYDAGTLRWWLDGVFQGESKNPHYGGEETVSMIAGQNGLVLLETDGNNPWMIFDTALDTWHPVEIEIAPGCVTALGREEKRAAFREPDGEMYIYDVETAEVLLYVPENAKLGDVIFFIDEDDEMLLASSRGTYSIFSIHLGEEQGWNIGTFSEYWVDISKVQLRQDPNGDYLYLSSAIYEFDGCIIRDWFSPEEQQVGGMLGYVPESNALLCVNSDQTQVFLQRRLILEDLLEMGEVLLNGGRGESD